MKKLLVSIATLESGGAERVLSILSKPFADTFDEVRYVTWEGGDVFYDFDKRVKIVSLPEISKKQGRTKQIRVFRRYVKSYNPDIIVSFLTPYNMLVLLSTMGLHKKVVVAERTDPNRLLAGGKFMLRMRDFLYKRASGILTQTEYAKSCYEKKLKGKATVIYNPITMNDAQVGKALRTDKEQLFVSVGRLEPVKDQEMMIRAFELFHRNHPNYKLVIYGDGPIRQQLETIISELGLKGCAELAGRNNNVWEPMSKAECFLLSSEYEGMSNAMIEAMCLGLPVISTKVAGATDLIKDGKNGFLVDVKDAAAMSSKMTQIADNDEMRHIMGKEAANVYEILRADKICQQWIDYLNSKLAE